MQQDKYVKMYHSVTDINDSIFDEIHTRIERIADILTELGYDKDDIEKFLKESTYPLYNFIN